MSTQCDSETGGLLKYFKGITLLNGVGFLLLVTGCGGGGAANTPSPPPALPVLSLLSSQEQVRVNTEFVLTWSSSNATSCSCLLYTSDAADDSLRVDLGGRRIIKKLLCVSRWCCTLRWSRPMLFFQAEDGIRDRSPSRGLGDVYKRQPFDS